MINELQPNIAFSIVLPIFYSVLRFLANFPHGLPQNCILVVPTQ